MTGFSANSQCRFDLHFFDLFRSPFFSISPPTTPPSLAHAVLLAPQMPFIRLGLSRAPPSAPQTILHACFAYSQPRLCSLGAYLKLSSRSFSPPPDAVELFFVPREHFLPTPDPSATSYTILKPTTRPSSTRSVFVRAPR